MKRFFAGILSVLLIAFLTSFSVEKTDVVKDVGYSLTANDQIVTVAIDSPVPVLLNAENEVQTIIDRGVSVPYKGLINQEIMIYNEVEKFQCNTYYTIERIDLKLPTLTGFEDNPDKYPFASDLGLRKS